MSKLFYFQYKEPLQPKEGDTTTLYTISERSFNIDKVVVTVKDGEKLVVILDDYHLRLEEVPVRNSKGTITSYKNRQYTHQTIITLDDSSDIERFIKLTNAE